MAHYVKNNAMAREIRLTKASYCEFTDEGFADFDVAVFEPGSVGVDDEGRTVVLKVWPKRVKSPEREKLIMKEMRSKQKIGVEARKRRLEKQLESAYAEKAELENLIRTGRNPWREYVPAAHFPRRVRYLESHIALLEEQAKDVKPEHVVFRLMTYDHIPPNPNPKPNPQYEAYKHENVNFVPFQHLTLEKNSFRVVGKSHWEGGMENGGFCADKGEITLWLYWMWHKMTQHIGSQGNWKGYEYLEDMKQKGMMQLIEKGLKFREDSPATDTGLKDVPNPFAYTTTIVNRAFTVVLNEHVHQSKIENELREMSGLEPSSYVQAQREWENGLRDQGLKDLKGHLVPLDTDEEAFKKELTRLRKQRIYNPNTSMVMAGIEKKSGGRKRKK